MPRTWAHVSARVAGEALTSIVRDARPHTRAWTSRAHAWMHGWVHTGAYHVHTMITMAHCVASIGYSIINPRDDRVGTHMSEHEWAWIKKRWRSG